MIQMAILDEVKRGGKQRDVCQLYNVDHMVIHRLQKNGPGSDWFDLPVRRQNIRHNSRRKIAECGPRLGVDVTRRACGVASADIRWSVA